MKVTNTGFDGLKLIELKRFEDNRGFFMERYNEQRFAELGLPAYFAQDNHSQSKPGVLRGLHYQFDWPQGKLVGVISGTIWDVAVDVRPSSPTYGKYYGVELSADNGRLLWIPPGFAHGFCVLGNDMADVFYKVTAVYQAHGEKGIRWNDPEFNIQWPLENPIISERDEQLPSFAEYKYEPKFA